jgi:hypothetical protein
MMRGFDVVIAVALDRTVENIEDNVAKLQDIRIFVEHMDLNVGLVRFGWKEARGFDIEKENSFRT